jgi:hypothetical protein
MNEKKIKFKEARVIARDFAVKRLQEMNFSPEDLHDLMVNYLESGNETILELYKPGIRPIDAELWLTVRVNMTDSTVTSELGPVLDKGAQNDSR